MQQAPSHPLGAALRSIATTAAMVAMAVVVWGAVPAAAAAKPDIPGIDVPAFSDGVQSALRQGPRTALVIGNADYEIESLVKTPQDAASMKLALEYLGFSVDIVTNGNKREIDEAIDRFLTTVRQDPGLAVFYYSGHGSQFDGTNYLIPLGFPINALKADYYYDSINLSRVIAALREVNEGGSSIIIVDACRSNPFAKGLKASTPGLAPVRMEGSSVAGETVVAFATEPHRVAYEGPKGAHSLFTQGVLTHLFEPGKDIIDVLKNVQRTVWTESEGTQNPTFEYRAGPRTAVLVPPGAVPRKEEGGERTMCDRLAAMPLAGYGPGVHADDVSPALAIQQCEAAIRQAPDEPRFKAWLGRALQIDTQHERALPYLLAAANAGFPAAQHSLANAYRNGWGTPQDDARAVQWFRKAAQSDLPLAQHTLGLMMAAGRGTAKDPQGAIYWYSKAAAQGYPAAQVSLGLAIERGEGVEADQSAAFDWYLKAAESGDAWGQHNVANNLRRGSGVEKDLAAAVGWFRKSAEQGNRSAQNNLGWMLINGEGTPADVGQGVYWIRKAAEAGYDFAQNSLGLLYNSGTGVEQNVETSIAWHRKAAEQGHVLAQRNLGNRYATIDSKLAEEWYRKAAANGDGWAQWALAVRMEMGQFTPTSPDEKGTLIRAAAEAGILPALRRMYDQSEDQSEKLEWLKKIAKIDFNKDPEFPKIMSEATENSQKIRIMEIYAEAENVYGIAALGYAYSQGAFGLDVDDMKAIEYLRKIEDHQTFGHQIKEKIRRISRTMQDTHQIFFHFGNEDVTPQGKEVLEDVVAAYKRHFRTIHIVGHTDTAGDAAGNQRRSEQRADMVKQRLVAMGVPAADITTEGAGETQLLVPTGPNVREPSNRRAVIHLRK